jgi:dihydrofolate reductase
VNGEGGLARERRGQGDISIIVVVAVAENGVIGRDGGLPWRIGSDLRHFRALTEGKPVVMGRKTFLSLGNPLKARTNIVISNNPAFAARGALVAPSLDAALAAARGDALRRGAHEIAIIGGSALFGEALGFADRLEVTRVHATPEGDTFLPPIEPRTWRQVASKRHTAGPQDEADFTFVTYERAH